jgi:hypothetical protein
MGAKRKACSLLEGKPEGKRPLRRSRCRWVYNIMKHLRETGQGGMEWSDLADRDQCRALVDLIMKIRVP